MGKFADEIGNAVREYMKDPVFLARMQYPASGKIFWVKAASSTGYVDFVKEHPAYSDAVPAVYTTVTLGMAALTDYDVLIITPGNYDEAATLTLSSLKGVKIIGTNPGMSWGEGSSCIRDVTSSDDLLDITGCQSLEIANICFVNSTAKDAINFTGLNYGTHIHHCTFIGNCGGADMMDYGINVAGSNGPDTYIHHCKFDRCDVAAIDLGGSNQRTVIHDCFFVVADAAIGINIGSVITSSYIGIWDCNFLGAAGDNGDQGVDVPDNSLPGRIMVVNCNLAGCVMTGGGTDAEIDCVRNYASSAAGGAIEDPT